MDSCEFDAPTVEEVSAFTRRILERKRGEELYENHLWSALYSRASGYYSGRTLDGERRPPNIWGRDERGKITRKKTRMSRREWIERSVMIADKAGMIVPLHLNRAQRRLEAWILRMERAMVPVRIQILKARQMGFSSYIEACLLEAVLRGHNVKALVVTDTTDRSKLVLNMARTSIRELRKGEDERWDFAMDRRRRDTLGFDEPIHGVVEVTSSESKAAGRGGTPQWIHMSEGAFWERADDTLLGILSSLPMRPGTYAFDESTANGESGKFYDDWNDVWPERDAPLDKRRSRWHPVFFAWWEHDEYRWTKTVGLGRELPKEMERSILSTLDEEEQWLLRQRYFERGEGWKQVSVDQLAWRREKINDKDMRGDINKFNQEYPSRPEIAFMAHGSPVFDRYKIQEYMRAVREPVWVGTLEPKAALEAMGTVQEAAE